MKHTKKKAIHLSTRSYDFLVAEVRGLGYTEREIDQYISFLLSQRLETLRKVKAKELTPVFEVQ